MQRPTMQEMEDELIKRENLEDGDEHMGLTERIVKYLFEHFDITRRE
jgi:hypothetical protein